jgi:hypothetical protein
LHLQDYNLQVLRLVTLPNLFLAALPFLSLETLHAADEEADIENTLPDLTIPGELVVSGELKLGFKDLLVKCGIELRFTYGDWSGMAEELEKSKERYDLIMTAETIYEGSSMRGLMELLMNGSERKGRETKGQGQTVEVGLEEGLQGLNVGNAWRYTPLRDQDEGVVLVGAKVSLGNARLRDIANGLPGSLLWPVWRFADIFDTSGRVRGLA